MSRQALSCAVLLLVVTLPSPAVGTKPDPAATSDSWAPLAPEPAAAPTPRQAAKLKAEKLKESVALNRTPAGYHDVKLQSGGVVRVRDQGRMPVSANSNEPYDPENADFSRTSSYANKDFLAQTAALSKGNSVPGLKKGPYATSAFGTSSYSNGDRTFQTAAYREKNGNDADFTKQYALPNPADYNKSFATKGSNLQDKSSDVTKTTAPGDPLAKPWTDSDKHFFDPTTLHVPHKRFNLTQSTRNDPNTDTITDLPNRPLSVDEVRNLINNGQVPDTNSKPAAPSKALNDPNWEPALKLPEISDRAAPATPVPDEAHGDELPSPGMMAQPADKK